MSPLTNILLAILALISLTIADTLFRSECLCTSSTHNGYHLLYTYNSTRLYNATLPPPCSSPTPSPTMSTVYDTPPCTSYGCPSNSTSEQLCTEHGCPSATSTSTSNSVTSSSVPTCTPIPAPDPLIVITTTCFQKIGPGSCGMDYTYFVEYRNTSTITVPGREGWREETHTFRYHREFWGPDRYEWDGSGKVKVPTHHGRDVDDLHGYCGEKCKVVDEGLGENCDGGGCKAQWFDVPDL